jgi:hypothetical protein
MIPDSRLIIYPNCRFDMRIPGSERRWVSPRYTWYVLPEKCRTVFFQGCSLTQGEPEITLRVYEYQGPLRNNCYIFHHFVTASMPERYFCVAVIV